MGKGKPKRPDPFYKAGDEIPDEVSEWFGNYWCGCGFPDEAMAFLKEFLALFQTTDDDGRLCNLVWDKYKAFDEKYGKGVVTAFEYLLTGADILEHGGSVPGWLTRLGINLKFFLEANPDYEP